MKFVGVLFCAIFFVAPVFSFPFTLEQRERFHQFLPRTFPKLEARDPVHVIQLGDSVTGGYTPDPKAWEPNNPLYGFTGVFLSQIAKEFFYPGGVRLLNPPSGGKAKISPYLGDEITLENFSHLDATSLTGLRHATTDAFVHNPDLVLVQYGIYDAFGRISVDTYRKALLGIVARAKEENADVILFSPSLVKYGAGEVGWGVTRPYATVAREVARSENVLYLDCGKLLAKFGGGVNADTEPGAVIAVLSDRLSQIFRFGPGIPAERVHPGERANDYLGEALFNTLKDGPGSSPFSYAGIAQFDSSGTVGVVLAIRNQTEDPQEGTIGALAVGGGLIPVEAAKRFSIAPGGTAQLSFRYRRPVVGQARDGSDILYPLEPSDEFSRFSFFVEDSFRSELVDLPLRIGPITAVWKSRQFLNVDDRIRVEWDLVNGTDKPVSGTFQVGYGDKVGQPTNFSASPLGTKTVFSLFDFVPEADLDQFQRDIWIQVDVGGVVTRFSREMEATRDLVLGEPRELRKWTRYANALPAGERRAAARETERVAVRFEADENALYMVAAIQGVRLPDLGERPALEAKIFLDARPSEEVMSFGAIEPIRVFAKAKDGPGVTPEILLGSFGAGYDMILDPRGIASVLRTAEDGSRLLEVRIPRSYLHRHPWSLENIESVLGIKVEITVATANDSDPKPFPPSNRWVSHSPTFAFDNQSIRGMAENDARSLMSLRLIRQPVASWSTRIY
ncbi:MAG: SGNH/GDSL hydrolase family protein [Verrucomicrobiales bacterium]|nr:SGNH/GDSL hydrolase family protein [Verrucomicrobiales bacterium]